LLTTQECLNSVEKRDAFATDFSVLSRVWESLYPDPDIRVYEKDYRWLAKVYESVKPASGVGRLLWVDLGPKTIKLIHEQVQVETIREDLDELVLAADLVAKLDKTSKRRRGLRLQISIASRLRGHHADLRFIALGERLERLKEQYEMDAISSLEWLKALIELAREVVQTEQENGVEKAEDEEEALTRIFLECKVDKTPEVIGQIVHDIDAIVKATRFDNWQRTISGEREIQQVLRRALLKYRLHRETDLFNKAYAYIREHY
jgi:type I restriction enzyme R subunit